MNQSDIEHYFKGITCSLDQKQDELKIFSIVNGGDFYPLGLNFLFFLFIFLFSFLGLLSLVLNNTCGKGHFIFFAIIFSIIIMQVKKFIYITFTVNSKGILAKSIDRKYFFISREEIDYCFYKKVDRFDRSGNLTGSFQGVCIKLKNEPDNSNIPNNSEEVLYNILKNPDFLSYLSKVCITTSEVDTGLCFNSKKPAKYLANEFNKYLGIEVELKKDLHSKKIDKPKKSKKNKQSLKNNRDKS